MTAPMSKHQGSNTDQPAPPAHAHKPKGQTVNYGQALYCTTADGTVHRCLSSKTFENHPIEPKAPKLKPTLSREDAHHFVKTYQNLVIGSFKKLAAGKTEDIGGPCQGHRDGFVPAIAMFTPYNQAGREALAQTIWQTLHVGCPRGSCASQRDACLRSETFPCLKHLSAG